MVRVGMVAAALALAASPLFAQESTEQLKKELDQLRAEVEGLKTQQPQIQVQEVPAAGRGQIDAMAADENPVMTLFKQTKLSGYVDTGYEFSFNHLSVAGSANNGAPGTPTNNPVRVFDDRSNSFYLNSVALSLERRATADMIVGYHLTLAAGHDPTVYDGTTVTLEEGWLQILAPIGDGLDIRVGKMEKLAGFEMIESMNDWNYSRSMLFGIQPFTTTGIRMSYSTGGNNHDMMTATLGLNNGFNPPSVLGVNSYADSNHGKGFEMAFAAKPISDFRVQAYFLIANENGTFSTSSNDASYLFDLVAEWTTGQLSVGANFDWQAEGGSIAIPPNPLVIRRSAVDGVALYGKFQANDWFAQALRVEYFSDQQGRILAPTSNVGGSGARVIEFTLTSEFKVAKQLIVRAEFRHDDSNQHDFNRDGHGARGDNTLGFEAIMPF
jgi:hypothetical protein